MVDIQRLVRDRNLTPEEAERYRATREQAESEKDQLMAYLNTSPPGFRSWEELAEFRALVKSLRSARETKGLSREDVARIAGLEPRWIADLEEKRELNAPVWALSNYATAVGQQLVMALADART
ncbi:MAG: helix-turn-helix domain-containing protein [Bythopirellula sp.]|nr:helix-turn-helix domain-containing protein [Bythopirellula sp.]